MSGKRKRVAGYIRVSRERDGMEAPEIYASQIEEWCERNGYGPPTLFEDLDYSGRKDSKPRPKFEEMFRRLSEFDIVVVPRMDRFGRSIKEAAPRFDALKAASVDFVALDIPGLDTTTSHGLFVRDLFVRLAELQSDSISDTWKNVHAHHAKQGKPLGGTNLAYGYSFRSKAEAERTGKARGMFKHPRESKIVRDVFDRYLKGESLHSIVQDLNKRGIKANTRRGAKKWLRSTVANMLVNPTYAGLRQHGGELYEGDWEAIVTRKEWEDACALREAARSRSATREGGRYLLSGLIVCGCGFHLHHHKAPDGGTRSSQYECRRGSSGRIAKECKGFGISSAHAERLVSRIFLETMSSAVAKAALDAPRSVFPKTADGEDFDTLASEVEAKMGRYVELLAEAGPAQTKALREKIHALETEAASIEQRRALAVADGVGAARKVEDLAELRARLSDLPRVWARISVEHRRELLRLCVERVQAVKGSGRGRRGKDVQVVWAEWLGLPPSVISAA